MLLIVEKGIRRGMYHVIHWHANVDTKYMKNYDENICILKSLYLKYWDVNNLYGETMSQKLPVNRFECIKYTSQCNEDFIKKSVMKKKMKDILLKLMFSIVKNYMSFMMICLFYRKEWNLEK